MDLISVLSCRPRGLLQAAAYCSLCSFMFGYHVHEKAILMVLIPLGESFGLRAQCLMEAGLGVAPCPGNRLRQSMLQ